MTPTAQLVAFPGSSLSQLEVYFVRPAGAAPFAAVVIIHEIFGLNEDCKAIAPYYGMNPRPLAAVARACPIVGSYPAEDFTAKGAQKLDIALDEYGVPHDIKIYPGAKHSFFNDQRSNYDPAAAEDSWRRVL